MYARGMTTTDIGAHIRNIYGIEVSESTLSRITDKVLPAAKERQQGPLEIIHAVVFMGTIHYHIHSERQLVKKLYISPLASTWMAEKTYWVYGVARTKTQISGHSAQQSAEPGGDKTGLRSTTAGSLLCRQDAGLRRHSRKPSARQG